jgi:hypothetical protein
MRADKFAIQAPTTMHVHPVRVTAADKAVVLLAIYSV